MPKVLDWLRSVWRMEPRGSNLPLLSPRCSTLVGRAQLAHFLAQSSLRPVDPLPFSGAEAVACELSREAIYWALLARHELSTTAVAAPDRADSPGQDSITLAKLWSEADRDLLDRAACGVGEAERLRSELLDHSFVEFAELSPNRQAAAAERLQAFAARLIDPLSAPQRAQERAWVARLQLVLAGVVVLIGLGLVGKYLKERYDLTQDLAPTASWKASSLYPECWCESPAQSCESCPNFFFHTQHEEHPNIVFDLHRIQPLSAIVVENRRDCCSDRGLPLIVEVSSDEQNWKIVAKRRDEFATWRESFPTEHVRWVRLSVGKPGFLHLAAVRLLP